MRTLLRHLLLLLAVFTGPVHAQAEWPTRPVTVVVPFPAGGSTDLLARDIANALSKHFSQPFVIENRPGAGSTIGTAMVARAEPDGYTFLITSSHFAISPALYRDLRYDPLKDLRGVSMLVRLPVVLVANPKLPVNSVAELVAYEHKHPGTLNYASSGAGGANHLCAELFNALADTSIQHIPYKGAAPAMQDLIGGQVDIMFDAISTALPPIRAGLIKPLGLTTLKRSPALPDVPTIDEAGVSGYAADSWLAMFAPAGVPDDIVQKVNQAVSQALGQPAIRDKQEALGAEVVGSTPAQMDEIVRVDMPKWSKLISDIGIEAK